MRVLVGDRRLSGRWRVRLEWKPADMWIGVYWADHGGLVDIWVCLLPCLPLHFWTAGRWPAS